MSDRTQPRQIIADEIIRLVHERWVGMKHLAYIERIEACRFVVEAQIDKMTAAAAPEMDRLQRQAKSWQDAYNGEAQNAAKSEARAIKAERALKLADQGYTAMRDALALVLPLAKGYTAANLHESNTRYCKIADDLLEGIV